MSNECHVSLGQQSIPMCVGGPTVSVVPTTPPPIMSHDQYDWRLANTSLRHPHVISIPPSSPTASFFTPLPQFGWARLTSQTHLIGTNPGFPASNLLSHISYHYKMTDVENSAGILTRPDFERGFNVPNDDPSRATEADKHPPLQGIFLCLENVR